MDCPKANFLTDLHLSSKMSFNVDYSAYKDNAIVTEIRTDADALRDALSTKDGAWVLYKQWKNRLTTTQPIDAATLKAKQLDGAIPYSDSKTPEAILNDSLNELDSLTIRNPEYKFTNEWLNNYMHGIKPDLKELFKSDLDYFEFMESRYSLLKQLSDNGYDIQKHFALRHKKWADYMRLVMSDMEQWEIFSILKTQPTAISLEKYAEWLKKSIYEYMPDVAKTDAKQKEIWRLVDYMVPTGTERSSPVKAVEWIFNFARPLAMFGKFTLWMMSGARLLYISAIGNGTMLMARTKGIESVVKSDFIDDLLEKEGILAWEWRMKMNVEFGQSWMEKLLQMAMAVWPESSLLKQNTFWVASKLLWGWHNMWDILADSYAKKAMVAEAMVLHGIDGYNINVMHQLYKDWKLPKDLIDSIRKSAHDKYDMFFTNSSTRSRTANRLTVGERDGFGKTITKLSFNFMQWYTMRRLGSLISSIEMFDIARKEWRIKLSEPSTIRQWLNTDEWAEYRNFLMTSLLSAKLATYVVTNQSDNDKLSIGERLQKIKMFAMGMNDYLSSAESSVPFKILDSLIEWAMTKYEKLDPDGVIRTYHGWVSWAVINTLHQTVLGMQREFNVFKLVPALMAGANTQAGWDFALESFDAEMASITSGQGRFLMDWTNNSFGLEIVDEPFDTTAQWNFLTWENNKTLQLSHQIRTEEDIAKYMDQWMPKSVIEIFKTLAPIVVASKFLNEDNIINKEATLNFIKHNIEKDKIANDLYNWVFNSAVLRTEAEERALWVLIPEWRFWWNIDGFFKELTSFSNTRAESDWTLELGSDYGINDTQYKAIEAKIIEIVWPQTYSQMIKDTAGVKKDDPGLIVARAALDAKVPGSGRLAISILAYKNYYELLASKYGKDAKEKDLTFEQKEDLQRQILISYGNQLVLWDKLAQNNMLMERMNQLSPEVLKASPEVQKIANSVTFIDSIIHSETKKGNINSRYLASVLSLAGKYSPDSIRPKVIENTIYKIDNMDIAANDKVILKNGVILGNIDYLGYIAKDPVMSEKHKETITNVLNMIYSNQAMNSVTENFKAMEQGELDRMTSKAYPTFNKTWGKGYGSYMGRSSKWYGTAKQTATDENGKSLDPNAQDNAKVKQMISEKLSKMPFTKRNMLVNMKWNMTSALRNSPKTALELFYVKQLNIELWVAQSQKLDNSSDINKINEQSKQKSKPIGYKSKKWKTVALKLPKSKKAKPVTYKW